MAFCSWREFLATIFPGKNAFTVKEICNGIIPLFASEHLNRKFFAISLQIIMHKYVHLRCSSSSICSSRLKMTKAWLFFPALSLSVLW